jgi:opacity protein-like surface antigen
MENLEWIFLYMDIFKNKIAMKKIKIAISAALIITGINVHAQTDSTRVRTSTTTTIETQSGTGAQTPTQEQAPAQEPQMQRERNDDFSHVYLGVRFMPTFTKFKVTTLDNGTAKTTAVVGYGFGGLLGFNFSKNVGLQIEGIYSTLSQKYTDRGEERQIDLSYIHFPLMLILNTDVTKPVNFNIAVGPQFGINTGSSLKSGSGNGVDTVQAIIAVKPADFGIAYGAGLDFLLGTNVTLDIGFRGVYGILDISDNSKTTTTNSYYLLDRSHVKTYAGYVGLKLLF